MHEWEGSKPKRFYGGLKVMQVPNRSETSLLNMNQESIRKGLENIKSKRHFDSRQVSEIHEWRPCVKRVESSNALKAVKITDLPCLTHQKPLRYAGTIKSQSKQPRTLWSTTCRFFKQEEQQRVCALETWEAETLKKPPVRLSAYSQYKSLSALSKY